MRVLYFSPRECWPLNTGARLRDYHLARQLARQCEVTYIGLRGPGEASPGDPPADSGFRARTLIKERSYTLAKLLRGLAGPTPVTILNYSSPQVARELAVILEENSFDTVQIEGVHLSAYLPVIRAARSHPAVISDWHNIESEILWRYSEMAPGLPRRLFVQRTARLVERAETRLLSACDAHTLSSAREREKLESRVPGANLHVVPNGVDVAHYSSAAEIAAEDRRQLVFVGSMDYSANIDAALWFAGETWPEVSRRYPALSLAIVGRNPAPEVRALARDRLIVTGSVSDTRPYYAGALAAVVPLRVGSGTRLKILEAMAAGVPVISTRLGAEGLEVEDQVNILLADSPVEMLAAIGQLTSSPEAWRRLAQAGRELVTKLYDWPMLGAQLYRIHCEALARIRSAGK
jgi:polysaccharide biosynthesis protein PslH